MILPVDQDISCPVPLNAEAHERAEIIPMRERISKFFLQGTNVQAGQNIRVSLLVPDEGLRIEPGGEKKGCTAFRIVGSWANTLT